MFSLNTNGTGYTILHSFSSAGGDGQNPFAELVQGTNDALYGTTYGGGSSGYGTVFKLNTNGTGYTLLHSFSTNNSDGQNPFAGLILGKDGALYGTTWDGATWSGSGEPHAGKIFKLNTDGSGYIILHIFDYFNGDGVFPVTRLFQDSGGVLYGTTSDGGCNLLTGPCFRYGTVFRLNTDGSGYTILHSFNHFLGYPDGKFPSALVQGNGGVLYGTTASGGYGGGPGSQNGLGTVFKLNPDGSDFTTLTSFSTTGGDGMYPLGLIQANDGKLYGTTWFAGNGSNSFQTGGILFSLNSDGSSYTILHCFGGAGDGREPEGGLMQGSDGALYGTTTDGGSSGYGTVFRLTTLGSSGSKRMSG